MTAWKFVVSDPETRKSYQLEVDQTKALGLVGKKIGDDFSGDVIGLQGYSLQITGGTDKDGFPMHPKLEGPGRRRMLLTSPPCFHPRSKGQRKRKTMRGNTVSEDIAQINCKVIKKGEKTLEELVPKKEKKEEKPKEGTKPEVKEEKKPKEEKAKPEEKKEEVEEKTGGEESKG